LSVLIWIGARAPVGFPCGVVIPEFVSHDVSGVCSLDGYLGVTGLTGPAALLPIASPNFLNSNESRVSGFAGGLLFLFLTLFFGLLIFICIRYLGRETQSNVKHQQLLFWLFLR
jgi:hypothetical protein